MPLSVRRFVRTFARGHSPPARRVVSPRERTTALSGHTATARMDSSLLGGVVSGEMKKDHPKMWTVRPLIMCRLFLSSRSTVRV